jgi:hypothetical protein
VIYAREFFDLQLQFARAVAALGGQPLARVLLDYTNLYIRLGLGRDFDAANPDWQEYLDGLRDAPDALEWTYRRYLRHPEATTAPAIVASFGCFAYARLGDERIRVHFQNVEADGNAPLGADRRGHRLAELAALFEHVRRTTPDPVQVVGASWLYNLEAYRRLFPPSYVATARVLDRRFRHMPLWGQFVDRRGGVRAEPARQLHERVRRISSGEELGQCFPLQALGVEAPASEFYAFYGV